MSQPPDSIDCVECGGIARLVSFLPEDDTLEEGYPLAYQCPECGERYDLVWEPTGDE